MLHLFAALVIASTLLSPGPPRAGSAAPTELDALEANQAFSDAWLRGDLARIERMLPPDFEFVQDGRSMDRAAYLAPAGGVSMTEWRSDRVRARVYGDIGVVTGRWSLAGINKGSQFAHAMLFTCVWRHDSSGWTIVAIHTSTIRNSG